MDLFAEIIGDEATAEDNNSIAVYFESEKNSLQAGRFFYKAGHYSKSMRHLLKTAASSNDDAEALNLAIEVVGASGQAHLSRQVRFTAQCGNFSIFLSFKFYVKSILEYVKVQKMPFL